LETSPIAQKQSDLGQSSHDGFEKLPVVDGRRGERARGRSENLKTILCCASLPV
jgi:hypothetical protein